jgi:uncharacterized protein YbcI
VKSPQLSAEIMGKKLISTILKVAERTHASFIIFVLHVGIEDKTISSPGISTVYNAI